MEKITETLLNDLRKLDTGDRIKKVRKFRKLTQEDLAKKCGKGVSTIKRYESGEQVPNLSSIHGMAYALDVPFYVLVGTDSDDIYYAIEAEQQDQNRVEILDIYDRMNDEGKERLHEVVKDYSEIDKYMTHNLSRLAHYYPERYYADYEEKRRREAVIDRLEHLQSDDPDVQLKLAEEKHTLETLLTPYTEGPTVEKETDNIKNDILQEDNPEKV